jgi:hypothetical protein
MYRILTLSSVFYSSSVSLHLAFLPHILLHLDNGYKASIDRIPAAPELVKHEERTYHPWLAPCG